MADWFKFHENDLDELRFKWAVRTLSGVCPVWVGILTECCRHKSDTIRWNDREEEIWAFGDRINQPPPVVRQAVELLEKIEYVKRIGDTLKVLRWKDKQSEYCNKKTRKAAEEPAPEPQKCPDSVRTVSGECPPRGEERRGEESTNPPVRPPLTNTPPPPPVKTGTGQDGISMTVQLLRKEIGKHYQRDPNARWSELEEHALVDVCRRRPNITAEWIELLQYHKSNPKYFPNQVSRLLESWDGVLDRARNPKPETNGAPVWQQIQELEDRISRHPCNRESKFHKRETTQEQRTEFIGMKKKLSQLRMPT